MESRSSAQGGGSGWAAFAGCVMFLVGSFGALWGLGAIFNDDIVLVGGQGVLIADITLWGWVHLALGIAVALTGIGLLTGNSVSRYLAVFLVSLNAISQIVWFPAAPLWSFLLILLDVTILYQLTVRWDQQAAWK